MRKQRARGLHTSTIARCAPQGGPSTGLRTQRGLYRISEVNNEHGRLTKGKLEAQRHAAKVGRWFWGKLNLIERRIVDAGLIPSD
jgi:hypothetical protein